MPSTGAGGERSTCRTCSPSVRAASARPPRHASPLRGRPGATSVESPAGRDAPLHRRGIGADSALDRDRDPERDAGAAGVLELAREDVQAVGERAGGERERRCPRPPGRVLRPPSSSAPGAVTGSFAVRTIWLAEAETDPSAGADERSVGAVLSKRTFVAHRRRGRVVERVDSRSRAGRRGHRRGSGVEGRPERRARVLAICVHVPAPAGLDRECDAVQRRRRSSRSTTRARDDGAGIGERDARAGRVDRERTRWQSCWTLPAASVMSARISVAPSGAARRVPGGRVGAVVSVATALKPPTPNSFTCHSTSVTPEPAGSAAVARREQRPDRRRSPPPGAVTLPVGCVRSTRTTRGALVVTLPPPSVATAISSHCCSAAGAVVQVTANGAVRVRADRVPAPSVPTGGSGR